jgi:hypothetical protein
MFFYFKVAWYNLPGWIHIWIPEVCLATPSCPRVPHCPLMPGFGVCGDMGAR